MTSAGRVSARDQLPRRDTRRTGPAGLETKVGTGRGEVTLLLGRVYPSSSWLPELLLPGKAQNAGPTESAPFVDYPRTWT